MNRLETEIYNLKMRAIMDEDMGLKKSASEDWFLHDCLKVLKEIQSSGNCNECRIKMECKYVPALGQMVRYNCPFYEKEGDEK